MKNLNFLSLLFIGAILAAQPVLAQTSTTNGDTSTGTGKSPAPTTYIPSSNMNGNSNSSGKAAMMGAAVNGVAAVGLFAASFQNGGPCTGSSGPLLCAMSASSLAQAALMMAESGGSGNSANGSQAAFGNSGGVGTLPNIPIGSGSYGISTNGDSSGLGSQLAGGGIPGGVAGQVGSLGSQLAGAGITANPDGTVTTPTGTYSPADLATPDAMAAAGFSSGQIAAAMDAAKKAGNQAQNQLKMMSLEENGGGGGGNRGNAAVATGGGGSGIKFDLGGKKEKRNPASYAVSQAGMTKQLDGDKIGVAGDDIFQMISRQYQKRDQRYEFIGK